MIPIWVVAPTSLRRGKALLAFDRPPHLRLPGLPVVEVALLLFWGVLLHVAFHAAARPLFKVAAEPLRGAHPGDGD
jgi:hypothetical protein